MGIYIIYTCLPRHISPLDILPCPGNELLKPIKGAAIKPEIGMVESFYFNII